MKRTLNAGSTLFAMLLIRRTSSRFPTLIFRFASTLPKTVDNDMPPAYKPHQVETGWYKWWEENNHFKTPSAKCKNGVFSIIFPPPNVTGTLHLGHALTTAIQDSLVSWNRMKGKEVTWYPGCDHAGIATQAVVEKKLKCQNTSKELLGREKFLVEVWKWKEDKEEVIYQQLKALGASFSWDEKLFTMDPKMCHAVNEAFIRLYRQGKIYRKETLVNWSCRLKTAISDIEVEHRQLSALTPIAIPGYDDPVMFGKMYSFAYKLSDSDERIVVSTTRPETIPGDTAVAVHPEDPRYAKFIGKFVYHAIRGENIPVIADPAVEPDFGTGALKVTPAHDVKDFELAQKHNLKMINIFDDAGIANDVCKQFKGLPRFALREKIIAFLKGNNLFVSSSPHAMVVPICSRSGDVIEPLLRPQWYISMSDPASKAMEAVRDGKLKIFPKHFENVWYDWLGNIRDWCISRQLWWGHRIPVYSVADEKGAPAWIAAHNLEQAICHAKQLGFSTDDLSQDNDVLDTWFSSSLFPMVASGWPNNPAVFEAKLPQSLMETGHDILFFWVARMVMMSIELTGKLPFQEVLLHGIICDEQGRKMSKSLGNVVDPLDIIRGASLSFLENQLSESMRSGYISPEEFERAKREKATKFPNGIPESGTDALRFTLCSYDVKSHYINLDMEIIKKNRNFCNKIWQAVRFLHKQLDSVSPNIASAKLAIEEDFVSHPTLITSWILLKLHAMVARVNSGLSNYDFHIATEALYTFIYSQLCDVFLEAVKSMDDPTKTDAILVLSLCLDVSLRCLAPFMPFISEELYQRLHFKLKECGITAKRWESVRAAEYPTEAETSRWKNNILDSNINLALQAVTEFRSMKKTALQGKREGIFVCPSAELHNQADDYARLIASLAGFAKVDIVEKYASDKQQSVMSRTFGSCSVILPTAERVDRQSELTNIQKKLKKLKAKLESLEATVSHPSFAQSAPLHVQEVKRKQVNELKCEIENLQRIVERIVAK